jgi:predicted DNA-binding transcriptional regulator YafY
MNRTDRLMAIITMLQAGQVRTAKQLATHFDISERTVFRDLKAIGEMDIPLHFEPEKGYSVYGNFFMPPVSLTAEEVNALTLAEPLVLRFADQSVLQHYRIALTKIKLALGRKQRKNMDKSSNTAAHYVPSQFAHLMPATAHITPLQHAITERLIVKLSYKNAEGISSEREVEPIGLSFYSLNWHLIAWCHLRKSYRDFRTNRIQQMHVTMKPFTLEEHMSLHEYLEEQQRIYNEKIKND